MSAPLLLIVARDQNGGIGKEGDLPWHLPTDLKFFQTTTRNTEDERAQNAVIMGRKTWESIPAKYRPLRDRWNIVVSRNAEYDTGGSAPVCTSLNEAIDLARSNPLMESIFVVGGGMLYAEVLKREDLNAAWITEIDGAYGCDTFFPSLPPSFVEASSGETLTENNISFRFVRYEPTEPVS